MAADMLKEQAVIIFDEHGLRLLCVLRDRGPEYCGAGEYIIVFIIYVLSSARKSIYDWKVRYPADCDNCIMKSDCCGLFATSKNEYDLIPIKI